MPRPALSLARPVSALPAAGHSLGGAVATLAGIRLLDALPTELHDTVSVVGFAVPPLGNAALAAAAEEAGWARRIHNYRLPEDFVPGLLGPWRSGGGHDSASASSSAGPASGAPAAAAAPSAGAAHERVCCRWGQAARACAA